MYDEVKKWLSEKLLQFGTAVRGYYVTGSNTFVRIEIIIQASKYGDVEFMKSVDKLEEELKQAFPGLIINFLRTFSL